MIPAARKYWWRTRRGFWLLRLAWDDFVRGFRADASWVVRGRASRRSHMARTRGSAVSVSTSTKKSPSERPVVFLSFCRNASEVGSSKFSGGEKGLNNLCLLLRRKGYEAFLVTWDGTRDNWLIDAAPTIALQEFESRKSEAVASRCVTSWIDAEAFLRRTGCYFYWDMESAYSDRYQFPEIAAAVRAGRIQSLAAFSRTIQGCLMARFGRPVELLPSLVDENVWKPDESRRVRGRVGYFDEGACSDAALEAIRLSCGESGAEFFLIRGTEAEVLSGMQTCEFFLALNPGKDPLWGEGGPYTPHEALACGAIPFATDLLGVRESIIHGFNGVIVPRGRFDLLGGELGLLLCDPARCDILRSNGRTHFLAALTMESRWPAVARFLGLD